MARAIRLLLEKNSALLRSNSHKPTSSICRPASAMADQQQQNNNGAPHHHFAMYKPPGVLTQFAHTARRRKKRRLLGEFHAFPEGTMAIGRLDEDSEGLLLLTTCGRSSNDVRDKTVEKEYYCQVDGQVTQEAIDRMKAGLKISTKGSITETLPCDAKILDCSGDSLPDGIPPPTKKIRDARHGPTSWVSITIKEGKYRQVRKMTAAVGFPTLRLIRVRVAGIDLDGLSLSMGEVRELETVM